MFPMYYSLYTLFCKKNESFSEIRKIYEKLPRQKKRKNLLSLHLFFITFLSGTKWEGELHFAPHWRTEEAGDQGQKVVIKHINGSPLLEEKGLKLCHGCPFNRKNVWLPLHNGSSRCAAIYPTIYPHGQVGTLAAYLYYVQKLALFIVFIKKMLTL